MTRDRLNILSMAILYCLGWFPVAAFALYMKHYEIAVRYSQLLFANSKIGDHPSTSDYLFIYKSDILFNFLVIPLCIIAAVYFFYSKRNILRSIFIGVSSGEKARPWYPFLLAQHKRGIKANNQGLFALNE